MIDSGKQKRPLLYLVNPRFPYKHYATQQETSELVSKKRMTVPLQLPLLAAITPDHFDIRIIDDEIEDLSYLPLPDLVGITTIAATSGRVFELADRYRKQGVKVVLGGSYASFREAECLTHADHIIVGEAEGTWQRFLADFEAGTAEPIYRCAEPPSFRTSPIPRWDLVDTSSMLSIGVETSRGCCFKCNFCVVNKMFGTKMRFRDVDDVVREIESLPLKRIFFVADNFAIKKSYARALVAKLKTLPITWVCQSSIDIANDEALLREMAEAGCISILVGFESLNEWCLENVEKHQNHVADYERAIQKIHAHGINVLGSFIVGFDGDTLETFDRIYDFITRNNLIYTMLNVLSVAPGTELFDRMERERRIHLVDPSYRNGIFPCIRYENITQPEMLDGFFGTLKKLFDWDNVSDRALRLFERGAFIHGGNARVTLYEKLSISWKLIRMFAFSRDRTKRRVFGRLLRLVAKRKLSVNDLVLFLLNMEGYNRYVENAEKYLPDVRRAIAELGPPPAPVAKPVSYPREMPEGKRQEPRYGLP